MKRILTFLLAIGLFGTAWAQNKPDSQLWFDSGMLFYGNKSVHLTSSDFAKTVKSWKLGKAHIAVSAETAPETLSQLIYAFPLEDVSYSLTLDKDRIAASASTERYYKALPQTEGIPFASADTKPVFQDGKMEEWIRRRVDELYPAECWENGIQGRVIVQFTIDEHGRTGNVKILKEAAPQLDRIAERIILTMPDWKPALDAGGNPIKVSYNLPIVFKHN